MEFEQSCHSGLMCLYVLFDDTIRQICTMSNQQYKYVPTRLREERERLGLTQDAAADLADVVTKSISRWESGTPIPADRLAALAGAGYDAQYVVIGVRSTNLGAPPDDAGDRLRSARQATASLRDQVDRLREQIVALAGILG